MSRHHPAHTGKHPCATPTPYFPAPVRDMDDMERELLAAERVARMIVGDFLASLGKISRAIKPDDQ